MPRTHASLPTGQHLARLVPEFDRLVAHAQHRDAAPERFGQHRYHELKERADALAEAIVAPFRKAPGPVNPPKSIEQLPGGGVRCGW